MDYCKTRTFRVHLIFATSRIANFWNGPSPELYLHRISTFLGCDMQYSWYYVNNLNSTDANGNGKQLLHEINWKMRQPKIKMQRIFYIGKS